MEEIKKSIFEKHLNKLDFIVEQNFFVVGSKVKNPYISIALEEANKHLADAVYFRQFFDRPPLPQIYIYNHTSQKILNKDFAEIHRKIWLSGNVPLIFVFTETEVKIFNCLDNPKYDKINDTFKLTIFKTIRLAAEIDEKISDFSAKQFDNGTFWENEKHKNEFKYSSSSFELLLKILKNILKEIVGAETELPKKQAKPFYQKLLLRSILVKYLEERKDEDGYTVFPNGFFSKFSHSKNNFISVLRRKGAIIELFEALENEFNGNIFRLSEDEINLLKSNDLNNFANFFDGYIDEKEQLNIWRLYSFNYLPIELISNIYEEFLEKKKGVVYTPPYLVNFLADQCLPLTEPKKDFKVFDPACGSGIFLVAAYKKLINWWRINNNWEHPNLEILKKILRENIFGADIEIEALNLTAFSLSIALCDELSPKVIWEELNFDDLKESNLFTKIVEDGNKEGKDFFEIVEEGKFKNTFDLIIGNPPFKSELNTPASKRIEKEMRKVRPKLPDNQISLLFLEQAINLCKKNSNICIIQPAGPFLYNNNSLPFRKRILEKYNVLQIFDFTALDSVLFGKMANVAVLSVFIQNSPSKKINIPHITIRRTKPSKEKIYFELDKYDFHYINFDNAVNNRIIWKSNLLGGGRLYHLMKRIDSLRSFKLFINEKVEKYNWKIGEGFIVGNEKKIKELIELRNKSELTLKEREILSKLEKKYKTAVYLTGKRTLPTEAFTEEYIEESKIHILENKYFYSRAERNKEIFKAPHLLIKEVVSESSIPITYREDDLSFKHRIIGIYSPEEQKNELKKIEERIKNNRLYIFFMAAYSSEYMIKRATSFIKSDFLSLPYPEDKKDLKLNSLEQILIDDVLDYQLEFRRKGEKAKAVQKTGNRDLEKFGDIYCKVLNSVYKHFKSSNPIFTSSFILYPFYYGKTQKINLTDFNEIELEEHLNYLINKEISQNLRIIRIIRIYEKNMIYLIKPDQIRYWLRSIAIRDADETFVDLVKQGY